MSIQAAAGNHRVRKGGSIVKTIGDAVMATFETPDRAIAAAIRIARGDERSWRRAFSTRACG